MRFLSLCFCLPNKNLAWVRPGPSFGTLSAALPFGGLLYDLTHTCVQACGGQWINLPVIPHVLSNLVLRQVSQRPNRLGWPACRLQGSFISASLSAAVTSGHHKPCFHVSNSGLLIKLNPWSLSVYAFNSDCKACRMECRIITKHRQTQLQHGIRTSLSM